MLHAGGLVGTGSGGSGKLLSAGLGPMPGQDFGLPGEEDVQPFLRAVVRYALAGILGMGGGVPEDPRLGGQGGGDEEDEKHGREIRLSTAGFGINRRQVTFRYDSETSLVTGM